MGEASKEDTINLPLGDIEPQNKDTTAIAVLPVGDVILNGDERSDKEASEPQTMVEQWQSVPESVVDQAHFAVNAEVTNSLVSTTAAKKEDIAELADKALQANINKQSHHIDQAEFETELNKYRLAIEKKKLALNSKWEMRQIREDSKLEALLRRRKNKEIKYGYLYDRTESGEIRDFSYSTIVNKARELANTINALGKPFKTAVKVIVIGGLVFGAVLLLKRFGII